jgi:TonB family protein
VHRPVGSIQRREARAHPERKIINKSIPAYPLLAQHLNIRVIVRIEVVVRPDGTVKSSKVVGGNSVLLNSATFAIQKWRFQSGPAETTETMLVQFQPC